MMCAVAVLNITILQVMVVMVVVVIDIRLAIKTYNKSHIVTIHCSQEAVVWNFCE